MDVKEAPVVAEPDVTFLFAEPPEIFKLLAGSVPSTGSTTAEVLAFIKYPSGA